MDADTLYIITAQIPGGGTHTLHTFQGHEDARALETADKEKAANPTMGVRLFGWHNPGQLGTDGICLN